MHSNITMTFMSMDEYKVLCYIPEFTLSCERTTLCIFNIHYYIILLSYIYITKLKGLGEFGIIYLIAYSMYFDKRSYPRNKMNSSESIIFSFPQIIVDS